MKIVRLSAKNVKRLRAVEITPDGDVVVVGGRNGQGKSSVLDAIMYALGGKDATCREPVRRGEKRAEIVVDLGEMVVRRTLSPDGSGQLVVESKDGARYTTPQTRLNDLIGRLSFDPLEFARMEPKRQAETLRALLGLDFAAIDGERARLFDERTDVNRDGKALVARFAAMPARHEGVPEVEQASAELIAEYDLANATNDANARGRRQLAELERAGLGLSADRKAVGDEIERLKRVLADAEARLAQLDAGLVEAREQFQAEGARVAALVDVDVAPIKARIADLEVTNRKVRENAERARIESELEAAREKSATLSAGVAAIDEKKAAAIAAAPFPVDGLGFSEDGGVTFGGLPFDQGSAAEQLRVSVAIGIALNPKLRVLLIRDASLLDAASLALVADMAEAHDVQLWLERVEEGGATVIIEDGAVVEPAEQAAS